MNREVYSRTRRTIDNWQTPKYFYRLLDNIFNFTLDPCTDRNNWLNTKRFFTKEDNGLKQDWEGEAVFVNPPFSQIKEWVKKCYNEGLKKNTTVVMILPSRTDTEYWHEFIMDADEIRFCKGRVNFLINGKKPKNGSTFPLAIVIFRKKILPAWPSIESFYHKKKDMNAKNIRKIKEVL